MLYERQKLLLAMLSANGGKLDRLDFQKLLFLYTKTCEQEPSYEFVPFKKGCYSFTSIADKARLAEKGFLVQHEDWELTDLGEKIARTSLASEKVKSFSGRRMNLRGSSLVAHAYREHPFWATRSQIASSILKDDPEALAVIEQAKPVKAASKLCSIGYEGRSLEGYMNTLLKAGVTILCDVRKNPLSRKFGFSKKMLSHVCAELDIRYEHRPQLGINSDERQELNTLVDYQALFQRYEQTTLAGEVEAVQEISHWIQSGECVALTCYERLPEYCHRTRVAFAVEKALELKVANL